MSDTPLEFKDSMKIVKKITKLVDGLSPPETTAVICLTIKNLSYLHGVHPIPFIDIYISALEEIKPILNSLQDTKGGPSVN